MLRVEEVADPGALTGLSRTAQPWAELVTRLPHPTPTLAAEWVLPWLAHRAPAGWQLRLAWRGDRLVGVAPLVVGGRAPVDDDVVLRSWHPVVAPDEPAATWEGLLEGRRWVPLRGVRPGALPWRAGVWRTVLGEARPTSVIDVAGAAPPLPSNAARNLAKARRRAAALEARHEVVTAPGLLGELARLERSGWKGLRGTPVDASPALLAFHTGLERALADRGTLAWHLLHLDGAMAALALTARLPGRVCVAKIAHDPRHDRLRPGALLTGALLDACRADPEVATVDLLTGMAWHRLWAATDLPHRDGALVRGVSGRGRAAVTVTVPGGVRDVVRRSEALRATARWVRGGGGGGSES